MSFLTEIFTGILAVLAVAVGFWQVGILIWHKTTPQIRVYTFGDQGDNTYIVGQTKTFVFNLENQARKVRVFGIPLPGIKRRLTLHDIAVQIFFPRSFRVVEVKRQTSFKPAIGENLFLAPDESSQYVFLPDPFFRKPPMITSLSDGEIERCSITVEFPQKPEKGKIVFDVSFREGEQKPCEFEIEVIENPV